MDPQNSGPNWSLCGDLESSIAIEFLVFIADLCRCLLFLVTIYFLSFYLDSISIDFDNVTTLFLLQQSCSCRDKNVLCHNIEFVCNQLFLYYCLCKLLRHNFPYHDKLFLFSISYSVTTEFSMSRQDFSVL